MNPVTSWTRPGRSGQWIRSVAVSGMSQQSDAEHGGERRERQERRRGSFVDAEDDKHSQAHLYRILQEGSPLSTIK